MELTIGIPSLSVICSAVICVLFFQWVRTRRLQKGLRLPPGPRGHFLFGVIPELRNGYIWDTTDKWAREFGDIFRISVLGKSIIFVNSPKIIRDVMEKKSSIYSDRPKIPMLHLMGWDDTISIMQYGETWRRHRKIFHQYFSPEAVVEYYDVQTTQARALLRMFHESPEDFLHHIRHFSAAIIMEISYGIKILPKDDPFVLSSEIALAATEEAMVPGKFLVNEFPLLRYIPEWMPGGGFHKKAREWKVLVRNMAEMPFNQVKEALKAGTAGPSIVGRLLEDFSHKVNPPANEENAIRFLGAIAYSAGVDTSTSVLSSFMGAMVTNLWVQRKAQAELDSVLGDRLPIFDDRNKLPYVNAICKEVHRWHPATPLGLGHRLTEDDVYENYLIPAGSIIIGNAWTILHDEKIYGPKPETFNPDRFLISDTLEPMLQYGYGRRICPGRHMADNSIFLAIASILKIFEILPERDGNGNEIPPNVIWSTGLLTHPNPFKCSIKPRSEAAHALLLSLVDD